MSEDWYWEGNIVETFKAYLQAEGWTVERTANTETREAGVDIRVRKGGQVMLVEAKGYPSKFYQRGEKKGQRKRTNPSTQARHWYSEVLVEAILRQAEAPKAVVAIVLPDFPVFKSLVGRTRNALTKLGITVYFIGETGSVKVIEPKSNI